MMVPGVVVTKPISSVPLFLAVAKQLYERSVCLSVRPSVFLSVHPSVCHIFFTMFPVLHHCEIFRGNYSISQEICSWFVLCVGWATQWLAAVCSVWVACTIDLSMQKVKVTEVMTPFSRFRTVTPVWIHIWWWNDAQSLKLLRRGALFFIQGQPSNFKVTWLKKASNLTQIGRFRTVTPVWIQ